MRTERDRYSSAITEAFSLMVLLLLPFLSSLLLFSLLCAPLFSRSAFAGERGASLSDPLSALRKGKDLLEKGKYREAAESFTTAYAGLPVIGDYTLFFMAKAYNSAGQFDESSRRLDQLLKVYPDSPLRKKARSLQVDSVLCARDAGQREKLLGDEPRTFPSFPRNEEALRYLEAYVADYPDDAEMSFFLARVLKKLGRTAGAKILLLKIYTGNNAFSELALRQLQPADITPQDMLAKASNHMKAFEHKRAETVLRKILPSLSGTLKEDVLKSLGQALFRQKRYREAAEAFLRAGDLYNGSRSLYRAGDLGAFRETVSRLISMEDKRAGTLLVAYAAKKRRDGRTEEALEIYRDIKGKYPSLAEDSLWGIAWTAYRSGDYGSAADVLTTLNDRYPGSRYAYWKQRAAEQKAAADNPAEDKHISSLRAQGDRVPAASLPDGKGFTKDFYRMLAHVRDTDTLNGRTMSRAAWTQRPGRMSREDSGDIEPGQLPPDIIPLYERFTILMELNMKDEAVGELVRISNRITGPDLLVSLCRTLQGVGAYKRSISMISRFSGEKGQSWGERSDVADLLYPLAYWPSVSEVAARYALDPYILLAVMREESRFDPNARSVAGALGLMQIMPHTAFSLDKQLGMGIGDDSEIYNVRTNLTVGAYYLNSLIKEFGSLPVALAAYNAGHDRVREWVKEGGYKASDEFIEDIPYDETRNYVKRVLQTYFTYLSLGEGQDRGN